MSIAGIPGIAVLSVIWPALIGSLGRAPRSRSASADSLRCLASERRVVDVADSAAGVRRPFVAGERFAYAVTFGRLTVGSGEMRLGADTLAGRSVWRATFSIDGGLKFLSVHDTNTSWFDVTSLNSLRFVQRLHEPRYRADRDMRIYPERRAYQPVGDTVMMSVSRPMDEVSLVYLFRTLALEPGQCYELHRYFQPEGNPIIIHVLRRERVTVAAGTFDAIVLRPEIMTAGIFSQRGRAELWLSDDSARVVVQLKSRLAFGSINLYLRSVSSGGSAR